MTETESIRQFYEKHFERVYRMCAYYLRGSDDTESAVHDVFIRYMTAAKKPSGEQHEIGWLMVTSRNICLNMIKRRDRIAPDSEDLLSDISEPQNEHYEKVRNAVRSLPDRYKDIVYLHYYEGMTTKQIADSTGILHSTVRSRLKRAKELLKKDLGDDLDE
ncbi:MAG: sigma-70 family RNA polymerase sigma factor [Schwartzia sp.]|nr:sigma-70 family RNA polymerase sigma factor [Schwartzia sp. (in: firmicutes)]